MPRLAKYLIILILTVFTLHSNATRYRAVVKHFVAKSTGMAWADTITCAIHIDFKRPPAWIPSTLSIKAVSGKTTYVSKMDADGYFNFVGLGPGKYKLQVCINDTKCYTVKGAVVFKGGKPNVSNIELTPVYKKRPGS